MIIKNAIYLNDTEGVTNSIKATINNIEKFIPLDPANTTYAEIMRQVDAGELTIEPADTGE